MRQQRRQPLLYPPPLLDLAIEALPQVTNRRLVCRNCAVALFDHTLQCPNGLAVIIIPVIRGSCGSNFPDDLPDNTPDIRSIRSDSPGRMSGTCNPPSAGNFPRFCQGDKDADNAVIADLARPVLTADKPLG